MRQLREAIMSTLSGAAAVTEKASGGVYARMAPEDTPRPYVVFFQQSGSRDYTYGRAVMREYLYVVKGVTEGFDDGPGLDLDAAVEAALSDMLDGVVLADGAGVIVECRRQADIDYPEADVPGVYLRHIGGSYRIKVAL